MLAVLGFDTAAPSLLEHLLEHGGLPALAELRGSGRWYALDRPSTDLEAGAYTTLYTGQDVSLHGLYYPFQWSAAEQRLRHIHTLPAPDSLWERTATAGRRSLVVDPYEARRPRIVEGVHLSGWQFTNRFVLRAWSAPSGARRALERRLGRAPVVEEVFGSPTTKDLLALRGHLLAAPGRVAAAVEELLPHARCELAWINFSAAHVAGHRLWELPELADPSAAADRKGRLTDTVAEVYRAVDEAIGRIVSALPSDADLVVFSPSGMAANTSRVDLLPGMLDAVLSGRKTAGGGRHGNSIWSLRATVPAWVRGGISRALPTRVLYRVAGRLELRGLDWERTRAFTLPSDQQGYVRLNVRGRERDGIVDPGEVDALVEEIRAGLTTFSDPDGTPTVQAVDRVSELVDAGPGIDRLPDLVVRWTDRPANGLRGVGSPRYGDVVRHGSGTGRTGNHTTAAWAILRPGASRLREPADPPHIRDLATTVCALLGADTTGLPGQPLLERR